MPTRVVGSAGDDAGVLEVVSHRVMEPEGKHEAVLEELELLVAQRGLALELPDVSTHLIQQLGVSVGL